MRRVAKRLRGRVELEEVALHHLDRVARREGRALLQRLCAPRIALARDHLANARRWVVAARREHGALVAGRGRRVHDEGANRRVERGGREGGGCTVGGRLARIRGAKVGVKGCAVGPERVAERVRHRVEEFGEAILARGVGPEVREQDGAAAHGEHGVGGRRVAQQRFEADEACDRDLGAPRQRVDALLAQYLAHLGGRRVARS